MSAVDTEIIDLLKERGLHEKLLDAQQEEREQERADLLQSLMFQEQEDIALSKKLAPIQAELERKVIEAEAAAATARRELCELAAQQGSIGRRAEKLRGQIINLADPRIEEALKELRSMRDKARKSFVSRDGSILGDPLRPGRQSVTYNNSLEVAEVIASLNEVYDQLEGLKSRPVPSDLVAFIEELLDPCRNKVFRLAGS
ncbi:hypothetical protein [Propionivibrio sp.]|uniref:hypothetical protein n=1 Tax=Propionivibrio sp. TaxID=2212460 RepID=UPI00272ED12E|nr:hypothetical protein [Propionivibrio sp.]